MEVEFKNPFQFKITPFLIWVGLAISFITQDASFDLVHWIFWLFLGIGFFLQTAPDFTLYEAGIEVRIWGKQTFVEWDNVQSAYENDTRTLIYIKKFTPPSFILRTLVNSSLSFGRWNKNYHLITLILKERLGKRYFGGTRKKR
jgi:hypothetical protein